MAVNNKNEKKDNKKYKVTPAEKKEEQENNKVKSLLLNHPQVLNNDRNRFHNENGKTIPEEVVPRGDVDQKEEVTPRNQGDLKDMDLRSIAVYAMSNVNKILMDYDPETAFEDALHRAIWSKDEGKYSGRLDANTYDTILAYMKSMKKTAASLEEEDMKDKKQETHQKDNFKKEENKEPESLTERIKHKHKEKIEQIAEKRKEEKSKEATMNSSDILNSIKDMEEKIVSLRSYLEATEVKQNPITDRLDKVASVLESQDDPQLRKLAYEIDIISDIIDGKKEASMLEGDSDENYMKDNFNAGVKEGDEDEKPYMNEYNTDTTKEVKKVASKLPYQIIRK